ncbi:MAG TPA: hypothetical protein VLH79_04065 [Chthonomonadales bacterium]|nr:hypothetical protein [Chthonomonadales bacterium]
MPEVTHRAARQEPRTLVGWHGLTFELPADWNVTGFSMDRDDGYLKVDSPGTMFVQVKWSNRTGRAPRSPIEALYAWWRRRRDANRQLPLEPPNLRDTLDRFLKQTQKRARKARTPFECKVKPETTEHNGERVAHNFTWTGGGHAQGKIWFCRTCGRSVVAQVVGQGRDNVGAIASALFSSIRDHGDGGWHVWALYDLVVAVPETFNLRAQKLMSGYLRLDFERCGERIAIERWGLANVTRRKFTIAEWLETMCGAARYGARGTLATVHGHEAALANGRLRNVGAWAVALFDALRTMRVASIYEGCAWECPETNKIHAIQVWRMRTSEGLLDEVAARCECH